MFVVAKSSEIYPLKYYNLFFLFFKKNLFVFREYAVKTVELFSLEKKKKRNWKRR